MLRFILRCHESKAVPKGNVPIPQDTSGLLGGIPLEEIRQMMSEALDKPFDSLYGLKPESPKKMRATDQRLAGLKHNARQPCLAMEVDVPPDKKTRKRDEDAAVNQAKHGDSCSAKKINPDPMCLNSFGDDSTETSTLPCRDDVLVDKGAAAQNRVFRPWRYAR